MEQRRLAIIGNQVAAPASSLPYGTPHSSYRLNAELARLTPADLFLRSAAEEPLPPVSEGFLEVRRSVDLAGLCPEYWAVYVPTGLLFGLPHALRPEAADLPIVCDIGTTFNVDQWTHLMTGLLSGLVRTGDGLIFKAKRTAEYFEVTVAELNRRLKEEVRLKTAVIPNGVDTTRHRRDPQLRDLARSWLNAGDSVVYLTWGRLAPFAKVDYESLIRSWAASGASRGNAILVVAGEVVTNPDYRTYPRHLLDVATELGVARSVVVVANPSAIWQDARLFLMSGADVFVHTTLGVEETLSLALLEAMSFGLVPIVSDWAGMSDVVGDGREGIVLPVQLSPMPLSCTRPWVLSSTKLRQILEATLNVDEGNLAHAIDALANSEELRKRLSAAARRRVERSFTWQSAAEERLSFMKELSRHQTTDTGTDHRLRALPDLEVLVALLAGQEPSGYVRRPGMTS